MLGLSQWQPGIGARSFWKKRVQLNASFAPSGRICGIFQYTAAAVANDKYIVFKNGAWYRCTITANAPTATVGALNFTSSALTAITDNSGITFAADKRIRAVQFGSEMFFVQDGGKLPVRYNGTAIYKLGIVAPAAATDGGNLAGGPMVVGADYEYALTYADELGRESSPSTYLRVTMGAGGGRTINWVVPTDAQVTRIYLYRTTALPAGGQGLLYRVVEAGFSAATVTYADNTVNDTLLTLNTPAPYPFQNDPPVAASLIALYKQRIALNSTANPRTLKISNLNQPGSFSLNGPLYTANGQLLNATDGITFEALNEYGDEITALGHLGSVLGVWNRRTTGIFEGDTPAEYQFRIVHRIGCIAPDSVQECGNATAFMAEDGIYALDYQSGFSITKLSGDMDTLFTSASVLWDPPGTWPPSRNFGRQERAASAIAVFLQNRYVLATPPYAYIYDFDNNGSSLDYVTGMPGEGGVNDSSGYMCMSRAFADRQYQVAFYSPGVGTGVTVGDLYVMSYYPLTQTTLGVPESASAVYQTRAFDGAGVHRSRRKRFKTIRLYGTIKPLTEADGTVTGEALLQGTVSFVVDQNYTFPASGSWFFDNQQQVSTDYVGRYWPRDVVRGLLFEQQLPADCVGFIGQVLVSFTLINGVLNVSDMVVDYDPLV